MRARFTLRAKLDRACVFGLRFFGPRGMTVGARALATRRRKVTLRRRILRATICLRRFLRVATDARETHAAEVNALEIGALLEKTRLREAREKAIRILSRKPGV